MKLAFIGNNDGPLRLAEALAGSGHEVIGIGMQKEVNRTLTERLSSFGHFSAPTEYDALSGLENLSFDVLVNCFGNFRYRRLLDRYRCINVHLGPLPRYRGRHPLQWALVEGEKEFGATVHEMARGYDTGPILLQTTIPVTSGWSAVQLREALLSSVEECWPGFVDDLSAGKIAVQPNDPALATYVSRRYPGDGEPDGTDWADHKRLWRKVMALRHDPFPAFLSKDGATFNLRSAQIMGPSVINAPAGSVLAVTGYTLDVLSGDGYCVRLETNGKHPFNTNDLIDSP